MKVFAEGRTVSKNSPAAPDKPVDPGNCTACYGGDPPYCPTSPLPPSPRPPVRLTKLLLHCTAATELTWLHKDWEATGCAGWRSLKCVLQFWLQRAGLQRAGLLHRPPRPARRPRPSQARFFHASFLPRTGHCSLCRCSEATLSLLFSSSAAQI